MTNAGANAYHTQQIMTASPSRLVARLYQAAIAALRQAIHAIENADIERRWRANQHAIEIIGHLMTTLDKERGGEIAANLERLYTFIIGHLVNVDLHNDPEPAREAIGLLEPLLRSWLELDQRLLADAGADVKSHDPAAPQAENLGYGSDKRSREPSPSGGVSATA